MFPSSSLHTKKTIFKAQIRKHHQHHLLSQLRQQAHMPTTLALNIANLPHSFVQLVRTVEEERNMPKSWLKAVSRGLYKIVENSSEWMEEMPPRYCLYLLTVVLGEEPLTVKEFDPIWQNTMRAAQRWTQTERKELLKPLELAVRNIDQKYLKSYHTLVHSNKPLVFTLTHLSFLNELLLLCPAYAFQVNILTQDQFHKLIQHLSIRFYGNEELTKMCEILIQVLYLSTEENVSKDWRVDQLLTVLEFFIQNAKSHLLVDRCLTLIYNLNIDASSKIFLSHSCVQTIASEIDNPDLPISLRQLMAETYLSAIINFPSYLISKFIVQQHPLICEIFVKIIEGFRENEGLMGSLERVIHELMKCSEGEKVMVFRKIVAENVELMEAVRETEFGVRMIQDWELV